MLLALDDTPDVEGASSDVKGSLVTQTEKTMKFWPPWPWPPWGGDEDDDGDDGNVPLNKTERAYKLAKDVVLFEKRIANASLDL